MKEHYIAIENGNNIVDCFRIGYTSEGGFFIMPVDTNEGGYLVSIIRIPKDRRAMKIVAWDDKKVWKTRLKPKITHHIDGSAHVSGTGIYSGDYKSFKKKKGVFLTSADLIQKNHDGGPIFGFTIWGNECMKPSSRKRGTILIKNSDCINDFLGPKEGKSGLGFLGFYLDEKALINLNVATGNITFHHPNYGIVPLKYVPGHKNTPGVIGILCLRLKVEFKSDFGVAMGGGPGPSFSDGSWEHMNVIHPISALGGDGKGVRSIEYRGIYKFYVFCDLCFFYIKKVFFKKRITE